MKKYFLYSNSKTVKFRPNNPINDQDKTLYKDVSNTNKIAMDYPPKLALHKISYVIFFKLEKITEKLIILVKLCLSLSSTSSNHSYLVILHRL